MVFFFFVLIILGVGGEECVDRDVSVEAALRGGLGFAPAGDGSPPIVDLASPGAVDALWDAATTVGFLTVTNHGIPETEIANAFDEAKRFFAQPLEVKRAQAPHVPSENRGFEYMSQVRPSTGVPDVKESLQVTAGNETYGLDLSSLVREAHGLAQRLMGFLESKLGVEIASAHTLGEDSQSTLRLLHYPPAAAPGAVRAGAHTDWGCITLLFQLPGNEGLECAAHPSKGAASSEWMSVDPVPGGIAVNVGDMLAHWSDGRLKSNLHRVRMTSQERYSIAFFAQADKSRVIRGDLTAEAYIKARIKSNY
ncbi:hypothetical protein CTAYLR_005160 [Chrysophaeum taylorii]|uniref:Fe2OG dioxygenase domain-containing protein n=1 Tax=Chrysophaeum taylorii TaxID=2483200 RepID=A0AAD7UMR9_9STRA|nr:hypothetical protein CTAYLR_005160 [Chrysophaeum taylorii]